CSGGVIRNGNEEWIVGYNRYLGNYSVFDAELWDILDELTIIQDMHYAGVKIQADSLEAVNAIQDPSLTGLNSTLVKDIHLLLNNIGP
ncbi:hypothetical protein Golob_011454, partial [Gossypium lobatum]|nr:hypothetical protein [Gossypium lobatum]